MVPRRAAQPRLEPLALPLPAAPRSPTSGCGAENGRRGRHDPEYELLDTGVFDDDRYWVVEVALRQGRADRPADDDPGDQRRAGRRRRCTCCRPLWFRNTWSWDADAAAPDAWRRPAPTTVASPHPFLGELALRRGPGPDGTAPELLFCDNETNTRPAVRPARRRAYPKDGINDHVVGGRADRQPGAARDQVRGLVPGDGRGGRDRSSCGCGCGPAGASRVRSWARSSTQVVAARRAEADEFYAELTPAAASADEALVMRQAFAGMLWSKQFYYYDVARWLDGDPAQPPPPPRAADGRNARWRNFDAFDIMSMPDTWEYPWFAAWDLAFHCVALAHVDPAFAKYQLSLLCREWFQHPERRAARLRVGLRRRQPAGAGVGGAGGLRHRRRPGHRLPRRVFDKLLVNFTWWVNREDADGSNLFEGGFLGLDNIGPIDRSHLPAGGVLEQSDATGWMAGYALAMATIATILQRSGHRPAVDLVQKFLEHFAAIRDALDDPGPVGRDRRPVLRPARAARRQRGADQGAVDGRHDPDAGGRRRRRGRCWTGSQVGDQAVRRVPRRAGPARPRAAGASRAAARRAGQPAAAARAWSGSTGWSGCSTKLFDPAEFLSPYGLRALSAYHRDHPYVLDAGGHARGDRLRARRVDDRDVRRQLQLARARCGSR